MQSRLQRVPTQRIKTRNSETTEPNQFSDTADQISLTPELLHWKQHHFISVKAEREKGNHTHPDSFPVCARVVLAKAPQHSGAQQAICSLGEQVARCLRGAALAVTQSKEGARGSAFTSQQTTPPRSLPKLLLHRRSLDIAQRGRVAAPP